MYPPKWLRSLFMTRGRDSAICTWNMHVDTRIVCCDTYSFFSKESCGKWDDHLGEWNKLMNSDCGGRLEHKGSFGFVQNAEKIVQVACFFFSHRDIQCGKWSRHTVYLIYTDMPARTRTWSSSHFYLRYITVNSRLKYVRFSGYPTDTPYPPLPSLLSILKDFPVQEYVQAEGTSIILIRCVCSFLEHSLDPSMKSTCAEPHMSL